MLASDDGHHEAARLLLDAGTDVNASDCHVSPQQCTAARHQ